MITRRADGQDQRPFCRKTLSDSDDCGGGVRLRRCRSQWASWVRLEVRVPLTLARRLRGAAVLGSIGLLLGHNDAFAQGLGPSLNPGAQPFNDSGIHSGPRPGARVPPKPPVLAPIPAHPDPWQRLDRGALICSTEAALEEHQAAVQARLEGGAAAEPVGCRIIREMTPVTILERHGPARTQVALPPPADPKTGWTDAPIPTQKPLGR
jgi:hypothetical protein